MNQEKLIKVTAEERDRLRRELHEHMAAIVYLDRERKTFNAENRDARKPHQERILSILDELGGDVS